MFSRTICTQFGHARDIRSLADRFELPCAADAVRFPDDDGDIVRIIPAYDVADELVPRFRIVNIQIQIGNGLEIGLFETEFPISLKESMVIERALKISVSLIFCLSENWKSGNSERT